MKISQIITIIGVCICVVNCKTVKTDNLLEAPDSWRQEVLEFPLLFARSLPYKGEEHIRFAEGWGDINSESYFSYVFLWSLDENPDLTITKIESDMNIYFTGLMKMGLITKFRFFKKLPKTVASFKEEDKSFEGIIEVYEAFFKKEMIILNTKISISYCNKQGKHFVYFRLSPKKFQDPIWDELHKVKVKFDCDITP
ncbi:hypothetical protein [Aquimarina sp. AU474]|uniref:hypothetical protein n=1 Tax=Aquimarina sp. AU474 TaxID=2108529 RepID=UPI00135B7177|nr:hypothetical protein [Aquimarina sp. AU474]